MHPMSYMSEYVKRPAKASTTSTLLFESSVAHADLSESANQFMLERHWERSRFVLHVPHTRSFSKVMFPWAFRKAEEV